MRMYIGDLQITAGESGFTGLLVLAPDKNSVLQAEKPGSFWNIDLRFHWPIVPQKTNKQVRFMAV